MSISQKLRNEIYFEHKKDPSIKRSLLAKQFSVSHKTVTKAIDDTRKFDIKALAEMGMQFHREVLKFQDKYRNSITGIVAQSNEYKRCIQEHEEYQTFIQKHLKPFNEQAQQLRDKMDNKVRVANNKSGVDLEYKKVMEMFKPISHLMDVTELMAVDDYKIQSRESTIKIVDKILNDERDKLMIKLNKIYEEQKAMKSSIGS